jgi:ketosteroid isomerase-like protein
VNWLEQYFDAWNRNDAAGVAAHMTDDVVFTDMAMRHTVVGIGNIAEFVAQSAAMAPGATFDLVRHFLADDHYWAEWVWQPLGIPGVSVGTVRDGKIAENHDYWNKALLKKAKPEG